MTRFIANPRIHDQLAQMPGMQRELKNAARQIQSDARSNAPRDKGDYAKSIWVINRGKNVFVATNKGYGHIIEWGSVYQPPQAPLRNAARSSGLRFVEASK